MGGFLAFWGDFTSHNRIKAPGRPAGFPGALGEKGRYMGGERGGAPCEAGGSAKAGGSPGDRSSRFSGDGASLRWGCWAGSAASLGMGC